MIIAQNLNLPGSQVASPANPGNVRIVPFRLRASLCLTTLRGSVLIHDLTLTLVWVVGITLVVLTAALLLELLLVSVAAILPGRKPNQLEPNLPAIQSLTVIVPSTMRKALVCPSGMRPRCTGVSYKLLNKSRAKREAAYRRISSPI
jgi:hypothetical protein